MRAINLKTNHLTAPLGMDAGPLFLSWQCVDGVRQTAYEIELTANGETVWHSGKVQSAAVHADAPTVGGSRVRGCWRVRLWDENDTPGAWSEAHFETGLAQSDWQGEWVDPETEEIDIPGDDAVNAFPLVILSPGEKIILCQPDGCACRPSALLSFQRDRMFFRSVYHDCDSTHLKFCCHGCFYSKHGPSNQLRNL